MRRINDRPSKKKRDEEQANVGFGEDEVVVGVCIEIEGGTDEVSISNKGDRI